MRDILVVSEDADFHRTISAQMPESMPLTRVSPAEYLERLEHGDMSMALVDEAVCDGAFNARVSECVRRGISASLVLIRRTRQRSVREVLEWAAAALPRAEWGRRGWPTVRAVLIRRFRAAMVDRISASERCLLTQAIEALLSTETPIRSVAALSRRLRCTRDGLNKGWDRVRGSSPLSLSDVIDVVWALDVVEHEVSNVGWRHELKRNYHARETTFQRVVRENLGMSSDDICFVGFAAALDRLAELVLVPLELFHIRPVRHPQRSRGKRDRRIGRSVRESSI